MTHRAATLGLHTEIHYVLPYLLLVRSMITSAACRLVALQNRVLPLSMSFLMLAKSGRVPPARALASAAAILVMLSDRAWYAPVSLTLVGLGKIPLNERLC